VERLLIVLGNYLGMSGFVEILEGKREPQVDITRARMMTLDLYDATSRC
jgi:hypothetical protein